MAPSRLPLLFALTLVVATRFAPGAYADDPLTCLGRVVTVFGTTGDDLIDLADGTHGAPPFVVATVAGDDRVDGSTEADVVCLGDGADVFVGGEGDDLASGEAGNDGLRGGPGADTLYGDAGDDNLFGGGGDDDLDGGEGDDVVRGNPGDDSIDGGFGDDVLYGGTGDDMLDGDDGPWVVPVDQAGVDEIRGGRGYDELYANWTFFDGDTTGLLHGGPDYDACALGAEQRGCERDHRNSEANGEEWRSMIAEVFARWGLDVEACGTINGAAHCVGGQVDLAVRVLMCESSGWPFSYNPSSGATGLFQNLAGYWNTRVEAAIELAATDGIATTLVPGAVPLDPVANTEIAAYLVYTSRETLIGDALWGGAGYPDNFDTTLPYYNSGWQRGPNPWGHWTCGDDPGVEAWDPAWIHPNATVSP